MLFIYIILDYIAFRLNNTRIKNAFFQLKNNFLEYTFNQINLDFLKYIHFSHKFKIRFTENIDLSLRLPGKAKFNL